jgi:glycosyltransferase involved in cell wall biosynthesis
VLDRETDFKMAEVATMIDVGNALAAVTIPVTGDWPRITLVTAVFNGEKYLEETIHSVLQQGYPNLEYIVVDDGSTDGTVEIIRKYERELTCWFSQENRGLYAALNAGFARSSGEIMGWINANDKFHTGGLSVVGSVFSAFAEVEWITGRATMFNDAGMTIEVQDVPRWSRNRFLAGANRHIQQESTFWRRGLWERAGGALSTEYRAEGDFELWTRFFRHAKIYPVDSLIGGWRFHENSLSHGDVSQYDRRCDEIVEKELRLAGGFLGLRMFRRIDRAIRRVPKVRGLWQRAVANPRLNYLYRRPSEEWAPVIEFRKNQWRLRP